MLLLLLSSKLLAVSSLASLRASNFQICRGWRGLKQQSMNRSRRRTTVTAATAATLLAPPVGEAALWISSSVAGGMIGTPIVIIVVRSWYRDALVKPSWCPPDGLFAPVWTMLYALMGYSALLAKRAGGSQSMTIKLFFAHYILNLFWAPLFFGLKRLRAACVLNFGLLTSLLVVMKHIHPLNPLASHLLFPYFGWLSFALALNVEICRLNPTATMKRLSDLRGQRTKNDSSSETTKEKWTPKQSLQLIAQVGSTTTSLSREENFIKIATAAEMDDP